MEPNRQPVSYREVYRSRDFAACEQRAFVLRAIGIEHVFGTSEEAYILFVAEHEAARAAEQLAQYEQENIVKERVVPPLRLHELAGTSTLAYAFALVMVAYCAGQGVGGHDWFQAGQLTATVTSRGEWWRVVTALTLHADLGHLLGNLAFGGLFGFFAAQLIGPGSAWLSILLAGALGNWVDSVLMLEGRITIGASTAVFATLGMVAAYAWKQHTAHALRWAHRWAPIVAAVALLAFTGSGGERTDVLAHLTGFGSGALVGLLHALPRSRGFLQRIHQTWSGALACIVLLGAWAWALVATA